jgi:replicative DNA helicase
MQTQRTQSIGARVPPHSAEAEASVLGAILLDNQQIDRVLQMLRAEDFYVPANRAVYEVMVELFNAAQPIDVVTLANRLQETERLAPIGGTSYLARLLDAIPTVANVESHARIVREKADVRRIIDAAHQILAEGYGDHGEVAEFLDKSERRVFEVVRQDGRRAYVPMSTAVQETFAAIEAAAERGETLTGLSTGITRLDRLTGGLQRSDLVILAGRPGMGKTAFALNIAVHAASFHAQPVVVFSLEMSRDQLVRRMLASEAGVDQSLLRTGRLARSDWDRIIGAAGALTKLPVFVDDSSAIGIMELRAKARRLKAEHGLGLVVVDYLQLVRGRPDADNREQEISDISRSLKALAKELETPVLALSQLNRAVESRASKDKRPQLADLRESGSIEQDADVVMFVYREEVYHRDTATPGEAEIIVGKQRNGPTGIARCRFQHEYTRFVNSTDEGDPD